MPVADSVCCSNVDKLHLKFNVTDQAGTISAFVIDYSQLIVLFFLDLQIYIFSRSTDLHAFFPRSLDIHLQNVTTQWRYLRLVCSNIKKTKGAFFVFIAVLLERNVHKLHIC